MAGELTAPWDSTEERLARSIRYQCARSLGYPKYRHGRIVPAQRERDRVEVNRVIGPAQLAHAVSPGARSACAPPARAGDFRFSPTHQFGNCCEQRFAEPR